MSPRCMLSIWFSHVWRWRSLSLVTLLATLFVSWTAFADDNPYHDSEVCIRGGQVVTIDGKQYTKINFNVHLEQQSPRNCNLRSARNGYPIYDADGKPLGEQQWLRSVYAANQGASPSVLRRCVPNSSPLPGATQEELADCPHSMANYMDVPSNGWIKWILIPRQPVATWTEKQVAAARSSCLEATSAEAKKACQDAGYVQSGASPKAAAPDVSDFDQKLNAALAQLSKNFSEDSLRLAVSMGEMASQYNYEVARFWRAFAILMLIVFSLAANRIRSLKKQLREARHQKTMPTGATLSLQNKRLQEELEKANDTIRQLSAVDHKLEKELLEQQHKDELLKLGRGWHERLDEDAKKYNERLEKLTNERNADIAERDNVIAAKDNIIAQQEGQIAAWRYRHKTAIHEGEERIGYEAGKADELERKLATLETGQAMNRKELETKHSAAIAEKDAVIGQLRNENQQLKEQLRAANDNARAAQAPQTPSTVTSPPSTVTIPQGQDALSIEAKYQATLNMERAIQDLIQSVRASSTDLEQKALDAGLKAAKLQIDLECACYCKQEAERDLAAKVVEFESLQKRHYQLGILYSLSQTALQKAVGSDLGGPVSTPPESGGVIRKAIDHGLGAPKVPPDLVGHEEVAEVPTGVVPAEVLAKGHQEGPSITVDGAPEGWNQEPYTTPDHSQVVERPSPPHTPTIPIASPPPDKEGHG
ncbi:MAG: hypothetical protein PHC70_00205 [Patescibacteria group bacterium]|nr:hypothetical protein [Patescibacteria group bacterium]